MEQERDTGHYDNTEKQKETVGSRRTFELAAVLDAIARHRRYDRINDFSAVLDNTGDIPPGYIALNDNFALDLFTADCVWTRLLNDPGKSRERDPRASGRVDEQLAEIIQPPAIDADQTNDQIEGLLSFQNARGAHSLNRGLNGAANLANGQAMPGDSGTVVMNSQGGYFRLLFQRKIYDALHNS